jgi:hypothetical protein
MLWTEKYLVDLKQERGGKLRGQRRSVFAPFKFIEISRYKCYNPSSINNYIDKLGRDRIKLVHDRGYGIAHKGA